MPELSEQEQQLARNEALIAEQRAKLEQEKAQAERIAQEKIPERKFGSGVTKEQQQQAVERRQKALEVLKEIEAAKQKLNEQQSQIDAAQYQIEKYKKNQQLLDRRKEKKKLRQYERRQQQTTTYYTDTLGQGISIAPEKAEKLIADYNKQAETRQSIAPSKQETRDFISDIKIKPYTAETYQRPVSVVAPAPKRFEDIKYTAKGVIGETFAGFAVGVYTKVRGAGEIGSTLIKKPFLTLPKSAYKTGKKIVTTDIVFQKGAEVGETIKTKPFYSTGYLASEILVLKAPEVAVKASDIYRTRGLKELPTEEIIAKEFPKQTYPKIKKGETAGELLKEFKASQLFEETKPAGFTASPAPLKELKVRSGSSEIPALYQSPELNPTFLKVSGEKGFIGANIFPTISPTTFRVTPERFKLSKGVSPEQSKIASLPEQRRFFKTEAEKGVSYVTFVKTEKESLIPFDTQLELIRKGYYFKFEGRRIPIYEYKTVYDKTPTRIKGKRIRAEELSSSSYKIKPYSKVNPYSVSTALRKSYVSSSSITKSIASSITSSISKSLSQLKSTGYTSKTGYPSTPSYPSYPSTPSYPSYPSTPSYPGYPGTPKPPRNPTPKVSSKYEGKINRGNLLTAYRTYVKLGGKKVYISGLREKGRALEVGQEKALRTLRATFGVEKTKVKIKDKEYRFTPSTKFRAYRIKQGKRIPLIDTYIQKRGTRLGTESELREIQRARRRR